MKWVKFSERFPSWDDKLSMSSEGEVYVRGHYPSDNSSYATIARIEDCHDWGISLSAEWLEGAFEAEVKL